MRECSEIDVVLSARLCMLAGAMSVEPLRNVVRHWASEKNESGFSFYCSTKKILSMSRLTINKSKVKLPDVVSASTDE